MHGKLLFIRTFQSTGTGGPVPPVDAVSMASYLARLCSPAPEIKILDMGLGLTAGDVRAVIESFRPDAVCCVSLIWEAALAHAVAGQTKAADPGITVIVQGQLPSIVQERLLADPNIDCAIIGEGEETLVALWGCRENPDRLAQVEGIVFRRGEEVVKTRPRQPSENIDELAVSPEAWDLVDVREYARHANWNGSLKEKFYMPVVSSRGCPFDCFYCSIRDVSGKKFRARSPENVVAELRALHERYGVREFHFFDPVFNGDIERAKKICRLIVDSGMKISLAFPHGVRADLMPDELIALLRKAGTYKLVFGIESGSQRLQKAIGKNLDLARVRDRIAAVSSAGIVTGGYFMLGFPGETREEMRKTIFFAAASRLDTAAFFKVVLFDDFRRFYESVAADPRNIEKMREASGDFSYYSRKRSYADISPEELNAVIFEAQKGFYLSFRRLWSLWKKSPDKLACLRNMAAAAAILIQSYLVMQLGDRDIQGSKT